MGELEILDHLTRLFRRYQLRYLLTGGYAVTYYGEPRATNDVDFLVEITATSKPLLRDLIREMGPDYIYDITAVDELSDQTAEFNVVHGKTGIKIDFWVIPRIEFGYRYKRKRKVSIGGEKVTLISAEDLILNKLFWIRQVFSERHFRDCVGIWRVQGDLLDKKYLRSEAAKRGILDLLNEISK